MARMGDVMLRTAWIFQAVAASPIFLGMGFFAIQKLFNTKRDRFYDFWADFFCSLLAAGIIFIVMVQAQLSFRKTSKQVTLRFEIAKALIATGLWLWQLIDAAAGPATRGGYLAVQEQLYQFAGICSILLL